MEKLHGRECENGAENGLSRIKYVIVSPTKSMVLSSFIVNLLNGLYVIVTATTVASYQMNLFHFGTDIYGVIHSVGIYYDEK